MKMTVPAWSGVIVLLIIVILSVWYYEGENFGDDAVPGTYSVRLSGEKSTLVLRPDHSFEQELEIAGTASHAYGT